MGFEELLDVLLEVPADVGEADFGSLNDIGTIGFVETRFTGLVTPIFR